MHKVENQWEECGPWGQHTWAWGSGPYCVALDKSLNLSEMS